MSYEAIICKLTNIRDHNNADRLKIATVQGYQVIIGLGHEEGELGVFFPPDGCLSQLMCYNNNLYSHKEDNKDQSVSGFFGRNGRVKAQKLRGEISEGFWLPLESLSWVSGCPELKEGYQFSSLVGASSETKICYKYFTPATLKAQISKGKKGKGKKLKTDLSMLHEHIDTKQLRHHIDKIPEGAIISISEKLHGTSGRTGRVLSIRQLNKLKRFWNKFMPVKFQNKEWQYVSGSRRVVYNPNQEEDYFYKGTGFRSKIHNKISSTGLHKGEVLYYEIVGFQDNGASRMPSHNIEDKKLAKIYGEKMTYSYGCLQPEHKIFIYRITMINEDGVETDYPLSKMLSRCEELGLTPVPLLIGPIQYPGKEALLELLKPLADGKSTLDPSHIREGVVVSVDHPRMTDLLKWKGFWFTELEGIAKNDDTFIDPEDIA
jgi:hypothetical protein